VQKHRGSLPVVAAIIQNSDCVLVAKRFGRPGRSGQWEFPGGKVEPGESPERALEREISEELGIKIRVGEAFVESTWEYDHATIHLSSFFAEIVSGDPRPHDHEEIRWINTREILLLDLLPADRPIAARLCGRDHDEG